MKPIKTDDVQLDSNKIFDAEEENLEDENDDDEIKETILTPIPKPQARKKRRTELENLEIDMKGWNTATCSTPLTAMMFQGTTVNREFMLMVEEAGVTAYNAKQNLESSGSGGQTVESSGNGVQIRTMESSDSGVQVRTMESSGGGAQNKESSDGSIQNMESSGCGVEDEDADYQFNNVMIDNLDENYQLFLL